MGGKKCPHGGELVAGVADEHTGLANCAVADRDALDEPGGTGRHGRARLSPVLRAQRKWGRNGRGAGNKTVREGGEEGRDGLRSCLLAGAWA